MSEGLDYYGDAGMAPSQPGNEDLGWEKTWTTNLGFHFGFWNRLNVDFELYNKRTSDMLMQVPQSYADKGYGYYWDNIGVMVNRGAEVNLSGTVVATKDFAWSLNANFSYNKNKILELYNGVQEYEMSATSMKLVVGHDSGEFYVNRFAGVYTEFDDRLLEDASFLRLKNLMLSYSFPQELLRKTRFINGIRIYAQAQNLFTFTKFSGLDPEGIGNMYQAQYPMSRQFTFGLDLTF